MFITLTWDKLWSRERNHESINNKQIVAYIDWFILSGGQGGISHWQLLRTTVVV